ncbi:uncharacterized protein LOC135106007 isoform X1 [Scylla paramamosain]|uniref:uncharacterized protein LOC135106007 isoform X1 n=1 Tax=Scylla paramamosain TaxID=85552 RepID=UPI003083AFDF
MEEGVLCLKWRDHRSTFLRMLSSVRKKGVFCDVTLVCEGKFYPVHQLVLSTCSEYFQQMFEVLSSGTSGSAGNTRTAGPLVVVLTGVSPRDLEALLEYMYAGEATILQGDLARFMKAAEGFKVHGLAEPPPPASPSSSRRESGEGTKRTLPQCEDSWERKRKKESGDHHKVLKGKEALPEIVSPAQLASVELAPETQRGMERDTATGTPGDLPGPVAPLSPPSRPQIKYEEIQVKEEPQNLEEVDEAKKEQGRWSHRQHQEQQALVLGEGAETAQLLGFCDPGLNYLAHTSGLGAVTDRGHSSHHHRNIHATAGWEAAGTSDNFPQLPSGHLRAASQIPDKDDIKTEVKDEVEKQEESPSEVEEIDRELFLTPRELRRLAEWLTICDVLGFARLREDVLNMVQCILQASGRGTVFPGGLPDQAWCHRFLCRHPNLAARMRSENFLLKSVISHDSLQDWFSNVVDLLTAAGGQDLLSDPRRVFSAGVMTFPISMSDGTVFEPRAMHDRTPQKLNQFFSIVTTVNAAGTVFPGTAVFPDGVTASSHSTTWQVNHSLFGTLEPQNFFEYLQAVFVPRLRREEIPTPVVVFLHGRHNSLVTPELCDLYKKGVVVVRALHPLIVMEKQEPVVMALTDPLAHAWSAEVKAWKSETGHPSFTTQDFLPVLDHVITKVTDSTVIKEAFRTSGLFPFQLHEKN